MSSFVCEKCKDTYGSEVEDEEEYLDDEQSADEESIGDEESVDDESDSGHQLIINEPTAAPQPPAPQATVKTEKNDKSLVIENSNSNQLVQKVSPSSKRKATTMSNAELLAEKAVVKQAVNGTVKAVRKKTTTTKSKKQEAAEENDTQLYCICRTPYNESQFYVQCESASCLEWYHGRLLFRKF